jgi:four helix bundle protein
LTNNIAEGHGRYHYPDQIKFTLQARGSLEELIDDLNACDDEKYVSTEDVSILKQQGWRVRQLVDGYIRYLRQQTNLPASRVKEEELLQNADADDSRFSM